MLRRVKNLLQVLCHCLRRMHGLEAYVIALSHAANSGRHIPFRSCAISNKPKSGQQVWNNGKGHSIYTCFMAAVGPPHMGSCNPIYAFDTYRQHTSLLSALQQVNAQQVCALAGVVPPATMQSKDGKYVIAQSPATKSSKDRSLCRCCAISYNAN